MIPSGVTSISDHAFCDCEGLTYFKFEGNAISESTDVLYNTPNIECVHVNAGTTGWGETWGGKTVVVDDIINGIKFGDVDVSSVFYGDLSVGRIYFGDQVIY